MVVVVVILVVTAIIVPMSMTAISSAKLRYAALNFAGLIQDARIEAVKKNSYFSVSSIIQADGSTAYYVDLGAPTARPTAFSTTYPFAYMGNAVTWYYGQTGPAPNQAALVAALTFAVEPAGAAPSFNARGLPCVPQANFTCPATSNLATNLGFVAFVSRTNPFGTQTWKAVAVTPSGRVQVWGYDGANWFQQ
ncbi:MAG: hypothetical protein NVS1B11_11940 [Terriglobales bacterium]